MALEVRLSAAQIARIATTVTHGRNFPRQEMVADLQPDAILEEAQKYLEKYEKAVGKEGRKHGGVFSRIRRPTYSLHESALTQATIVKEPLARAELVAGVIDSWRL